VCLPLAGRSCPRCGLCPLISRSAQRCASLYPGAVQRILVKRAVAGDAERLTALIRDSNAYRGQYGAALRDYEVTIDYIERQRVFAAFDPGGVLLGVYGLVLDPPVLDLLFVANDAQGRGVGRHLVQHMIGQARLCGLTVVQVVSHPPAEPFYQRMGARRVGTVPARPPLVTWDRPELQFTV
jgi:GNAT superfamily N-acetyltransferase